MNAIAFHNFNSLPVGQRLEDGYLNATAMCQASDKLFSDYFRLKTTQDFLKALSETMGIPIVNLVQSKEGRSGGTWIHPLVAVNLGQWCSAQFAVIVSRVVCEWNKAGMPDFREQVEGMDFLRSGVKTSTFGGPTRIQELELELSIEKEKTEQLRLKSAARSSKSISTQKRGYNKRVSRELPPTVQRILAALNDEPSTAQQVADRAEVSVPRTRTTLACLYRTGQARRDYVCCLTADAKRTNAKKFLWARKEADDLLPPPMTTR